VFEIRKAEIEDIETFYFYLNDLRRENLSTVYEQPREISEEKASDFVNKMVKANNSTLFVAAENGQILGALDFHGSHRKQQRHCGAFAVTVAATQRGQGIGSKLIQFMFDWASSNQITRIELEVFATNVRAIKLYERLGFVREGIRTGAVLVGGIPVDIILMARRTDT
jgi:RimJ/RimL family protein N-acetyltransferase